MTWRNQPRHCAHCSEPFEPKREKQTYCTPACRNIAKVRRHRSGYTQVPLTQLPDKRLQPVLTPLTSPTEAAAPYFNPHGPTPGALQGDDYPLTYDADG